MDINAIYGSRMSMGGGSFMAQQSLQSATTTLKEAGDSLKIAARTLTQGLGTLHTAYNKVNPIVGHPSQAWIPGKGESYIQAPSFFSQVGRMFGSTPHPISRSPYGTGNAALHATTTGDAGFRSQLTGLSWMKGATSLGGTIASTLGFVYTPAMLAEPLFEYGKQVIDRAATRTKLSSDVFRLSPAILPPALSGNIRGGFGKNESIQISGAISKMAHEMDDSTLKDLRAMNMQAIRSGWFDKVKNAKGYLKEFRDYVSTVKDASGILDTTVTETGQLISKLRSMGVKGRKELMNVISTTQIYAEQSGVNATQLLSNSVGTAQQLSMQSGIPLDQAIKMVAHNTTNARLLYKTGMIGDMAYRQFGGAQGIGKFVSQVTGSFGSTAIGQSLLTRLAEVDKDGNLKLNKKNYIDFTEKGIGVGGLLQRDSTISMSDYYVNKRLLPQLIKDNPKLLRGMLTSLVPNYKGMTNNQKILSVSSLLNIDALQAKAFVGVMGLKDNKYMEEINEDQQFQQRERTLNKEKGNHWYGELGKDWDSLVEEGSDLLTNNGYYSPLESASFSKALGKISINSRALLLKDYDEKEGFKYNIGKKFNLALSKAKKAQHQLNVGDGDDALDYVKEAGVNYGKMFKALYSVRKDLGDIDISDFTNADKVRYNNERKFYNNKIADFMNADREKRKKMLKGLNANQQSTLKYGVMHISSYIENAAKTEKAGDIDQAKVKLALDLGMRYNDLDLSWLGGDSPSERLVRHAKETLGDFNKVDIIKRIKMANVAKSFKDSSKDMSYWMGSMSYWPKYYEYTGDTSKLNEIKESLSNLGISYETNKGKDKNILYIQSKDYGKMGKYTPEQILKYSEAKAKQAGVKPVTSINLPNIPAVGMFGVSLPLAMQDRVKINQQNIKEKLKEKEEIERKSRYATDAIGQLAKEMKVGTITATNIVYSGSYKLGI